MVKLDVSPPGMEPLTGPTLPNAQGVLSEEGFVYGHAVKQPRSKPPDVEGMMKAAGIPGPKEGGLPHSLEWYRGAKERQAAREKEKEELLIVKNDYRKDWASIITDRLEDVGYRVDCIMKEPQPLGVLAELLARTAHERPNAVDRIQELRTRLAVADQEKERLNLELANAREGLRTMEDSVRRKKVEGDEEEEERLRLAEEERQRKAKAEKQLRRNAALLRGEEWTESDSDASEDEGQAAAALAADGEDAGTPGPSPALEVPPTAGSREIFGSGQPPTPGAVRGGLAQQLPPITDPPPPPRLED
mmetsp:Transcript_37766/g.108861  ORF Transcript_37766/g.108861 Transcript_37766/m.108861 type:complete len:304 (-) Transcript_37766:45-956(-)